MGGRILCLCHDLHTDAALEVDFFYDSGYRHEFALAGVLLYRGLNCRGHSALSHAEEAGGLEI